MKYFLFIFLFFLIFIPPVLGAAPSIPQNFDVNISENSVNISWDASTDPENDSIVYNWVLVNSSGYENITHTVRNESMVLYTHFNDGTSTDWSLYGNNGTDTNVIYELDQNWGYSAKFNGIDSYINCANGSSLDITGAISIEVIFNQSGQGLNGMLVDKSVDPYPYGGFFMYLRTGAPEIYVGDGINSSIAHSPVAVTAGEWTHVIGTYDGEYTRIYQNAVLVKEVGPHSDYLGSTGADVYIGRNGRNENNKFGGATKILRVYNRTLSSVEINANSNIIAESASYDNFTTTISNLPYGDYHFIVSARDNSTYSEWSEIYNFSIVPPLGAFKATFKIIDQYRSDLVYNTYINGTYITDFNITDAYFINTTNDTSITLTASKNYLDITNLNNVRNFILGILGFVLLTVFLYMAFKIGRGR